MTKTDKNKAALGGVPEPASLTQAGAGQECRTPVGGNSARSGGLLEDLSSGAKLVSRLIRIKVTATHDRGVLNKILRTQYVLCWHGAHDASLQRGSSDGV